MKRLFVVTGTVLILIMLATTISAAVLWSNTSQCLFSFSFNGSTGRTEVEITTTGESCEIDGTIKLYRKVAFIWIKEDEWSDSAIGDYLSISGNFTGVSGTTYKAKLDATVTRNGVTDVISREIEREC